MFSFIFKLLSSSCRRGDGKQGIYLSISLVFETSDPYLLVYPNEFSLGEYHGPGVLHLHRMDGQQGS
jgi:hypothetical protein